MVSTPHLDRLLGVSEPTDSAGLQSRKALFWACHSKDPIDVRNRVLSARALDVSRDPWSSGGPPMDLSFLEELSELRSLEARFQKFADAGPLLSWLSRSCVESIDLTGVGEITEDVLRALSACTSLTVLRLSKCSLSVQGGAQMRFPAGLVELTVTGLGLKSSAIFSGLSALQSLEAAENDLTELGGLSDAVGLKKLIVNKNMIADLAPLARLRSLQELDVSENALADLEPLRDLRQLRNLKFARNRVRDIRCLRDLDQLEAVSLSMNPLHESDIDDVLRRSVRVE